MVFVSAERVYNSFCGFFFVYAISRKSFRFINEKQTNYTLPMIQNLTFLPKKSQIVPLKLSKMEVSRIRMKLIFGYASALRVKKSIMIGSFDVIVN